MTTHQEMRAAELQKLRECVQVRLQPLRVVIWAADGHRATTLATPDTTEQAEEIRENAIAERIASWDRLMASTAA